MCNDLDYYDKGEFHFEVFDICLIGPVQMLVQAKSHFKFPWLSQCNFAHAQLADLHAFCLLSNPRGCKLEGLWPKAR